MPRLRLADVRGCERFRLRNKHHARGGAACRVLNFAPTRARPPTRAAVGPKLWISDESMTSARNSTRAMDFAVPMCMPLSGAARVCPWRGRRTSFPRERVRRGLHRVRGGPHRLCEGLSPSRSAHGSAIASDHYTSSAISVASQTGCVPNGTAPVGAISLLRVRGRECGRDAAANANLVRRAGTAAHPWDRCRCRDRGVGGANLTSPIRRQLCCP
jgi:hypothetical protein